MSQTSALMEVDDEIALVEHEMGAHYAAGRVGRGYELALEKRRLRAQRQRLIDNERIARGGGPLAELSRRVEVVCMAGRR